MARLKGEAVTVARLLGVQSGWSYERMQGVGLGWAGEPALGRLLGRDNHRYRRALARATGFFNANPYLAAAALGAELRAEHDQVAPQQIERLRTALCGPLGALGDRLFWTGVIPALSALGIVLVALGGGAWPILGIVLAHNLFRIGLAFWLLRLGWDNGLSVGNAMQASALPRTGSIAVKSATVLCAAAIPIAVVWLLAGAAPPDLLVLFGFLVGAVILRWFFGRRVTVLTLTLIGAGLVISWQVMFG